MITKLGWNTKEMVDALPGVLNLAAASGKELGTTSDIMKNSLTDFGLKAKDSAHFADILAAASTNSNTNINFLSESFKHCSPACGSLGISVKDTSFALGLMAKAGIKGSSSGNALSSALKNLKNPTKQTQNAMNKLGISIKDSSGKVKNGKQLFDELRQKFSKLSDAQKKQYATTIFGKDAMSGMLAIINASDKDYNKLYASLNKCDGAAQKMSKSTQNNLNGSLKNLKSAFQEMQISLSKSIIPILTKVVKFITKMVNKFNSLPQPVKSAIGIIVGSIALLSPAFLTMGKLIKNVFNIIAVFRKLNKVSLIFKKIPKIISNGLRETLKILKLMKTGIGKITKGIGKTLFSLGKIILKISGKASKAIIKILSLMKSGIFKAVKGIGKTILKLVKIIAKLPALINPHILLAIAIIAGLGLIVYTVVKHWDVLKKKGKELGKNLKDTFKNAKERWGNTLKDWKKDWKSFENWLGKKGEEIGQGLLNGLKKGHKNIRDWSKKRCQNAKDDFKKLFGINSPSRVFDEYGVFIGEGLLIGLGRQEGKINNKFKDLQAKIKDFGMVRPNFNTLAFQGAIGSNYGLNGIQQSKSNFAITQNVKMYLTIPNADKEGATKLAGEFKNMTESNLKNSITELFMSDAIRD